MKISQNKLDLIFINVKKSYVTMMSIIFLATLCSCSGSRVSSSIPCDIKHREQHPINTIAMAPGGGVLADAIAVALTNKNYKVFDAEQMSNFFMRLNLNEIEVASPQNLCLLKDKGIDSYLTVKSAAGYDGLPESASVRLNSTHDGKVITGVSWQNGWGGRQTSLCDRVMRKNVLEAAKEIVGELSKNI